MDLVLIYREYDENLAVSSIFSEILEKKLDFIKNILQLTFQLELIYKYMSDVAEKVKKIIVEHLGAEESKVTENASFTDDLGADSLDTVELVMAFEEEFGIEIPDDAAEKIKTVKDAVDFISSNKK